jgi:hypothetical protein
LNQYEVHEKIFHNYSIRKFNFLIQSAKMKFYDTRFI